MDGAVDVAARARRAADGAGVAAQPCAAAQVAPAGARYLSGQPCDRAPPQRERQRRRSGVDFLYGAGTGQASAVRFLRRGVHPDDGLVQHRRACRSGGVPRYRRRELRPARRHPQRNPRRDARGALMRGAAVWVVFALIAAPRSAVAQTAEGRTLVIPFENVTREPRIFWLGEASAVLLSDDLAALGASAITRPERQEAFERLQVPPVATLTDATVIRIGQIVGADQVVTGSLQLEGDDLVVHARRVELESGGFGSDVPDRGPLAVLYPPFERAARRIMPASSRTTAGTAREQPPVAAFENYIKGVLAETPATGINYLHAALAIQPSYDRARLALWDIYTDQGEYDHALAAVAPVAASSPLARDARFLAGLSQLELKRYDEAFATFKALADAQPDAAVLNNLGIVQLRRGATPETGQATYFFNKAASTDPADADYQFNLGYAYWSAKDPQAAVYWLREAVRRRPTDGEAHFILAVALSATGNSAEAAREKELAFRLSSSFAQWERRPA